MRQTEATDICVPEKRFFTDDISNLYREAVTGLYARFESARVEFQCVTCNFQVNYSVTDVIFQP